ncbi:MAG: methyltransferase domain-containing protein [Treponema sp.]|nr:methyltransferase domain-containing protein [Treponema sp.]
MRNGQILIVPAAETGRGGGHLSRCITLVKDLRSFNREAVLYIKPDARTENLLTSMNFNNNWLFAFEKSFETYDFIILDRYKTSRDEIIFWKNLAPVIGIDEGGAYRDSFDFLIDILIPLNFIKPSANITSFALSTGKTNSVITRNISSPPWPDQNQNYLTFKNKIKILISFGHEDPACLGVKTARILSSLKSEYNFDITLLTGALSRRKNQIKINNVTSLEAIPNLASRLHEYDLVITHYGITAYEALFFGTPVLLDHPTTYHRKIAKAAGFQSFSLKNLTAVLKKTSNNNKTTVLLPSLSCPEEKNQCIAELVNSFFLMVNKKCPVCGDDKTHNSVSRFNDRSYRRCKKCGIIYMDRINAPPIEYDNDYFFDSYIKQYGKTYLEDFENIKKSGIKRMKTIKNLHNNYKDKKDNPSLLDIGCAYGPFLAAAKEEGYSPFGIDPAKEAARYVNETLGIPAIHSFFPVSDSAFNDACSSFNFLDSFNAITLWFVIEHFTDCLRVLNEIKKYLKPNGILAFSTPSFSGVSGRSDIKKFLSASPADHFTIWSPSMCKKALFFAGFKAEKIINAGHHPERFPFFGKFAKNKKGFIYNALHVISRLFALGDTFEVYARKI